MPRLTNKERHAILDALAFMGAGELDECAGRDRCYEREHLDSAGQKIADGLRDEKPKKRKRTLSQCFGAGSRVTG